MVSVVWHYHQEQELGVLNCAIRLLNGWQHFLVVVVLDSLSEGIKQDLFVDKGLVGHWTDVCVLNLDIQTLLLGQSVEFVVDEVSIGNILFKANNCEAFKIFRLMNHLVETVGVLQGTRAGFIWSFSWVASSSLVLVVVATSGGLLSKVWSFINHRFF